MPSKPSSTLTTDPAALVAALATGDTRARRKAAERLAKAPTPDAFEALTAALHDPDDALRIRAASALAALGNGVALDALRVRLPLERRPKVLDALIGALGRFPVARAAESLVAHLRANPRAGQALGNSVSGALGAMGKPGIDAALGLLQGPAGLAVYGLRALGNPRATEALPAIVERLQHAPEASVREAAALALGAIDDPSSTEALVAALVQGDTPLAQQAAVALSRHRNAAPRLRPLLRARDATSGRAAFVFTLGPGDASYLDDLVPLLLRRDAMVWARQALLTLEGGLARAYAFEDTLARGLAPDDLDRAAAAAYSLAWIASVRPDALSDATLARVVAAMNLPDDDARARIAEVLAAVASRASAAVLARLTGDDDRARHTAIVALAQSTWVDTAAAPALAAALRDERCAVWAAEALRRLGPSARGAVAAVAAGDDEGARRARRLLAAWGLA